jgi:hypothetical protein
MWIAMMVAGAMAAAAAGPVQRLSDAEVARVLDEAARKREAAEAAAPAPPRALQGEAGVEVGSGGYRAVYGSAFVPIGEEGGAVVTFSNQHGGNRGPRR